MQPPCDVKALYEYKSEHDDDLNFAAGQVIHVSAVEDEEWLSGSYKDNAGITQSGIFPKNFVELIEAPKAPARPTRSTAVDDPAAVKQNREALPKDSSSATSSTLAPHEEQLSTLPTTTATAKDEKAQVYEAIDEARSRIPDKNSASSQPGIDSELTTQTVEQTPPRDVVQAKNISTKAYGNETHDSSNTDQGSARTITEVSPASGEASALKEISNQEIPLKTATDSVAAKPVKSNAFRDRIAAFNKQGAAPVAPKPMAKPNLARKPFIAPPPSKDAYPVAASHVKPQTSESSERVSSRPTEDIPAQKSVDQVDSRESPSTQPIVVGSLKDRIAALQAEQRQAAAKKAVTEKDAQDEDEVETLAAAEQHEKAENTKESAPTEHIQEGETEDGYKRTSVMPPVPVSLSSADNVDHAPPSLSRKNTNRSIEMIDPQNTGASSRSVQQMTPVKRVTSIPAVPEPIERLDETVPEDDNDKSIPQDTSVEDSAREPSLDEEVSEEDEVDEEEVRKQQLRARMAKMSGGGMGMHMALGFAGPPAASRAPKNKLANSVSKSADVSGDNESTSQPVRVPMPGLSVLPSHEPAVISEEESARDKHRSDELIPDSNTVASPPKASISTPAHEPLQAMPGADSTDSLADLDASKSPSLSQQATSLNATLPRAVPPPIPGGRPMPPQAASAHSQLDEMDTTVPSMSPASRIMRDEDEDLVSASQRLSLETTRGAPPPIPQTTRLSTEQVRAPPPIPSSVPISRPSLSSPPANPESPILSPNGSKRVSYFGAPSSSSSYRPSMESTTRRSVEQPRASFDTLSRTNSHGVQAPSRPPPPTVPAVRAPPPPVPVSSPPMTHAPMPPARAAPSLDSNLQGGGQPQYPRSYESQAEPPISENEREGYEADDDDTDIQSVEPIPAEVPSQSTPSAAQIVDKNNAKKKGIKGLFKRKDKA